jgi:ribosome-binding factor A
MLRERSRHLRVASELTRVVNALLQAEVKDPRLHGVTISATEVSGDLRVAKLFYSPLDPNGDCAPVEEALRNAAGFLRGRVAKEIRMRYMPELRFVHDEAARRGAEVSRILAEHGQSKPPPDPSRR